MKQIITALAVLVLSLSCAMADDKPVSFNLLPQAAQTFVNANYPGEKISYITVDDDLIRPDYKVVLVNGVEIQFNNDGSLEKIEDAVDAAKAELQTKIDAINTALDALKAQLTPYKIGKYGQIQEWQEDWDKENNSHRHLSHLWGAYPGNQVSPYVNPTVYQGVHKSLVGRGDAARGWSMGWKVCQWARMRDGDHALLLLDNQLRTVDGRNPEKNRIKLAFTGDEFNGMKVFTGSSFVAYADRQTRKDDEMKYF